MKMVVFSLTAILLAMLSCEDDGYINDQGIHDPHVNMTTYDFLASHPKFDSLVRIIDRAGMKDLVNSNITFFVTTNWGVADYVSAKKQEKIIELGDENIDFGIDHIDPQRLDSLKMYMFEGAVTRERLTTEGAYYESLFGPMPNTRFLLGLRRTRDYSEYVDYVDYLYYTKVIGGRDSEELDSNSIPDSERDQRVDIQTSGIITTTGVVHVLQGAHRLFFNQQRMASN